MESKRYVCLANNGYLRKDISHRLTGYEKGVAAELHVNTQGLCKGTVHSAGTPQATRHSRTVHEKGVAEVVASKIARIPAAPRGRSGSQTHAKIRSSTVRDSRRVGRSLSLPSV